MWGFWPAVCGSGTFCCTRFGCWQEGAGVVRQRRTELPRDGVGYGAHAVAPTAPVAQAVPNDHRQQSLTVGWCVGVVGGGVQVRRVLLHNVLLLAGGCASRWLPQRGGSTTCSAATSIVPQRQTHRAPLRWNRIWRRCAPHSSSRCAEQAQRREDECQPRRRASHRGHSSFCEVGGGKKTSDLHASQKTALHLFPNIDYRRRSFTPLERLIDPFDRSSPACRKNRAKRDHTQKCFDATRSGVVTLGFHVRGSRWVGMQPSRGLYSKPGGV